MSVAKNIAGLILAFLLGIAIMTLYYERFGQPNYESFLNAEAALSLYDYAQIICIEDSPIWPLQEIQATSWEDMERNYARTYARMSQVVPPPSMKSYHESLLEMNSILRHQAEQNRKEQVSFSAGTEQFLHLSHSMVSILEEETKEIPTVDRLWLAAYGC
ncbi:MAG: hypothetical protein OXG26_05010 [Caldilineaceae bacterium]|nr:hypothetical protein [Caldilineaceae bacterium]MDE0632178.1 hypothetical protein [Caldilineaceae bacterium]